MTGRSRAQDAFLLVTRRNLRYSTKHIPAKDRGLRHNRRKRAGFHD